jgi:predicted nuclease with TOPRIM domain
MKNQHELKELQVRLTKLQVEIKNLEKDKSYIINEIIDKKNKLNSLRQKIKNLTIKEPIISEHAMLRYIERIMNINLDDIANRILTKENLEIIKLTGNCKIKSEGIELIVKDSCVISVLVRDREEN